MLRLCYLYHLRKPRVVTEVDRNYKAYQTNLRLARRAIHLDSVNYLNSIEEAYLDRHKQQIKDQHQEYQCSFRKQIFTDAFRLQQNQLKWKQTDEHYTSSLNKHLHEEDVKKINRSRILKIMEHESEHYWFNSDNVQTRLKEESIFPEYIASSEYYYKLFAEALAYELGDFHELHMVSSNEEIIIEKNRHLIPLYLTLRSKITAYKRDQVNEAIQKNSFEVNLLKKDSSLSAEESQLRQDKLNEVLQAKLLELEERNGQEGRLLQLRKNVKDLTLIFKTWKEYTNILALTSAQIIKNRTDVDSEVEIHKSQKEILRNLTSKMHETFLDSIEEDTEEVEVSFEDYLVKINQDRKDKDVSPTSSASMEELDTLMGASQVSDVITSDTLTLKVSEPLELGAVGEAISVESGSSGSSELSLQEQINPLFLSQHETTSSVQILKAQLKSDKEMVQLLNQLGQIDVRYPKLFEMIWQSSE